MTIDPSKAGPLGVFVMPTPEKLANAVRAMHSALAAVTGAHTGQLDRVISLTSTRGPVGLGFLDLYLGLDAPGSLREPIRAAAQVSWVFTAERLAVKVAADVGQAGTWTRVFRLETVVTPKGVGVGRIAYTTWMSEPLQVRTRKDRVRHRPVPVTLYLDRLEQARPIGTIPGPHNGQWLPFQA
jgi:hypothetical protein